MANADRPAWAEGQFKLRDAMYWWIQRSTERWKHTPWGGGHDELGSHGYGKFNYELGNLFLDLFYYTRRESYAQAVHKMLNTGTDWRNPSESDSRPVLALMNKSSEQFLDRPRLVHLRMYKNDRIELDNRNTAAMTADNTLVGSKNGPLEFASATLDGRPVNDAAQGISIAPGKTVELRKEPR